MYRLQESEASTICAWNISCKDLPCLCQRAVLSANRGETLAWSRLNGENKCTFLKLLRNYYLRRGDIYFFNSIELII